MNLRTAVLTMTMLAACTAGHAAMIANGGFETGNFDGWNMTGNVNVGYLEGVCQTGSSFSYAPCSVHSGGYAAALGPNGPAVDLYQDVATTAGIGYTLMFYLQNDNMGGSPDNSFNVLFDGKNVYSIADAASFGYAEVSISGLTASSYTTQLDVLVENVPGGFFLDDVSLTAVPEPACLFLVAAPLGILGLIRQKRRTTV